MSVNIIARERNGGVGGVGVAAAINNNNTSLGPCVVYALLNRRIQSIYCIHDKKNTRINRLDSFWTGSGREGVDIRVVVMAPIKNRYTSRWPTTRHRSPTKKQQHTKIEQKKRPTTKKTGSTQIKSNIICCVFFLFVAQRLLMMMVDGFGVDGQQPEETTF